MMRKYVLGLAASLLLSSPALATGCNSGAIATPQPNFTATSGNVAAATATATLAAPPAQMRWNITGFEITGLGATAGAGVSVTISGLDAGAGATSTATYSFASVTGVTLQDTPLTVSFAACPITGLPGTAVSISMPSLGSGNTNAAVNIHGFLSQ